MGAFDVRDLIKADSAGSAPMSGDSGGTRTFHPLAERIAAMPVKQTLSPVLIEGLVRLADVLVILGVGGLIFGFYVAGKVDYALPYQVTVPLMAAGALGVFQALHLYHVGALRNFIGMVVRVSAGWTVLFDGTNTDAFRGYRKDSFPETGWVVEDGALLGVEAAVEKARHAHEVGAAFDQVGDGRKIFRRGRNR